MSGKRLKSTSKSKTTTPESVDLGLSRSNNSEDFDVALLDGLAKSLFPQKMKRLTKSKRAGLSMPVTAIFKRLRKGRYANKIRLGAGIYMASVLDYLVAEVTELAGQAAQANKKKRITPRHLTLAIRNDVELNQLLSHVTIPDGGVLPHIEESLLPKETSTKKNSGHE